MDNDAYLKKVDGVLRGIEKQVFAQLRPVLAESFIAIRNLLLLNIPDEGLARNLSYNTIKPLMEEALVELNDTFRDVLGEELRQLQLITLGMANDRLNAPTSTYELYGAIDLLKVVRVFGGWTLKDYFTRRSPSQFMKEILRLVDRKVQEGLMKGWPTEVIASKIVPEAVLRRGKRVVAMSNRTIVNAVRNRVEGTISQAIWTIATNSERQVWDDEDSPQWIWSAVLDERTCKICTPFDGQVEASRDDFRFSPPVHPNCRCRILPYGDT